ncbi:Uncharacterised protein [Legionella londiniensis]|uniref:Uncharacterized protein n=1 Tax=Legionella londiniensis TaxID=45068 RepID=A0A0W0VQ94_9GAMM|nr:hypothetical protein Llon_1091 [Legionella londiniensis]STX92591.1 Uncharacterised protein [Legionella londiniensis]
MNPGFSLHHKKICHAQSPGLRLRPNPGDTIEMQNNDKLFLQGAKMLNCLFLFSSQNWFWHLVHHLQSYLFSLRYQKIHN